MKSSTPIIVLVVALGLILVGVLIYVFVVSPVKTASPKSNPTTPNNPTTTAPLVTDADLTALANKFYNGFQAYDADSLASRCSAIEQANNLSPTDLQRFLTIYESLYSNTVKQEMDDAYQWCGLLDTMYYGAAQQLYDKL